MVDRENLKDSILDATESLLARHGYRKMTIENLARAVGIGKGSVYLYYSSKKEIVLAYVDRIFNRMSENLREIAETKAHPADRIERMLVARVQAFFDCRQQFAESVLETLEVFRADLMGRFKRHLETEVKIFASVLLDARESGAFYCNEPELLARGLVTATNALLPFAFGTRELGSRADVLQSAVLVAKLLTEALSRQKSRIIYC